VVKKIITVGQELFCTRIRDILGTEEHTFRTAATNDKAFDLHVEEHADMIVAMQSREGMGSDVFCSLIRRKKELLDVAIVLACESWDSDLYKGRKLKSNGTIALEDSDRAIVKKLRSHLYVPKRHSYRVVTRIGIGGGRDNTPLYGFMLNLSATGLLIESESKLEQGEELNLSFFLPKSKRIVVTGEVVRVVPKETGDCCQYGIRFAGLDARAQQDIENFVTSK
jgi:Tfp pilus assembly protein PilZ